MRLQGLHAIVAGSGALGLAVALELQARGAQVLLVDPAPLGDNASGVAAGMLAPAFEAVIDPVSAGHFPLLRAARDAWPGFADRLGAAAPRPGRTGALWVGDEASQADMLQHLARLGAEAEALTPEAAAQLSPGLVARQGAVMTPEDWRLDAGRMLAAMRGAFLAVGGRVTTSALVRMRAAQAELESGELVGADAVVLATGMPPTGLEPLPPGLDVLQPIKGQIVRFAGAGPTDGPVVRAPGIYVSPSSAGAMAGATMQAGECDRRVEQEVVDRLVRLASPLFPQLADAEAKGAAGVRASTPDGLPLVGAGGPPGLWLALGARRNGWLLAPLVACILADRIAGDAAGDWAGLFDPARFAAGRAA